MCEPLLTHRNETTMASKLGSVGGPGTKARLGGSSVGELAVCGPGGARCIGGVSFVAGAGMEQENLSLR